MMHITKEQEPLYQEVDLIRCSWRRRRKKWGKQLSRQKYTTTRLICWTELSKRMNWRSNNYKKSVAVVPFTCLWVERNYSIIVVSWRKTKNRRSRTSWRPIASWLKVQKKWRPRSRFIRTRRTRSTKFWRRELKGSLKNDHGVILDQISVIFWLQRFQSIWTLDFQSEMVEGMNQNVDFFPFVGFLLNQHFS